MGLQTVRVHRTSSQHNSIVVVIPILITSALKIDSGDYVVFSLDYDTMKVEFSRFGKNDEERKSDG